MAWPNNVFSSGEREQEDGTEGRKKLCETRWQRMGISCMCGIWSIGGGGGKNRVDANTNSYIAIFVCILGFLKHRWNIMYIADCYDDQH